jgi:hypothetical protein
MIQENKKEKFKPTLLIDKEQKEKRIKNSGRLSNISLYI